MLLVSSLATLLVAGGGIAFLGQPGAAPGFFDALLVLGTVSTFVLICSAEARLGS